MQYPDNWKPVLGGGGEGGGGCSSKAWNRVFILTPVKRCGWARLSTDFHGKETWWQSAFVKFCKHFACFMFKHVRKSSSCSTFKCWTFWGTGDKHCTVNLWAGNPLRSNIDVYFKGGTAQFTSRKYIKSQITDIKISFSPITKMKVRYSLQSSRTVKYFIWAYIFFCVQWCKIDGINQSI